MENLALAFSPFVALSFARNAGRRVRKLNSMLGVIGTVQTECSPTFSGNRFPQLKLMSRRHKGRCSVFVHGQDTARELPRHFASRAIAHLVVSIAAARWLDDTRTALQLVANVSWADVKLSIRPSLSSESSGEKWVGLKPPLNWYSFVTSYPPIPRESGGRRKQAEIWMRASKF